MESNPRDNRDVENRREETGPSPRRGNLSPAFAPRVLSEEFVPPRAVPAGIKTTARYVVPVLVAGAIAALILREAWEAQAPTAQRGALIRFLGGDTMKQSPLEARIETELEEARQLVVRNRLSESLEIYQRLQREDLGNLDRQQRALIAFEHGNVALGLGYHDEAERLYRDAISADRFVREGEALNNLACVMMRNEDRLDEATELVEAALVRNPENPYFVDTKGSIELARGNHAAAIDCYIQALKGANGVEGLASKIHEHLGDAYLKDGQFDRAVESWRRAAVGDPMKSEIWRKIGLFQ